MSSKKEKRIEKKKRKLEVFLQLTEEIDDATNAKKRKCEKEADPSASPGPKAEGKVGVSFQPGPKPDKPMAGAEIAELRARLREKQKAAMQAPKLFLILDKLVPTADSESEQYKSDRGTGQPSLFLVDLQHLLLFATLGNTASFKPRWCNLIRCARVSKVLLFVVDGISSHHFEENSDCFPFLKETFSLAVEMKNPHQFGQTAAGELFRVPVSKRAKYIGTETGKIFTIQEEGNRNGTETTKKEVEESKNKSSEVIRDSFPRTDLLMNVEQMVMDNYPMPSVNQEKIKDYVFTKSEYKPVTDSSPLFAIDCEMCQTSAGQSELTRVAVVDERRQCLFDRLVKPRNPITNYLTRYSGITKEMLENVTTRIEDVQKEIRELLPSDAILVGQSFNHDLHALKMFHPYIIDTSLVYNLSGDRCRRTNLRTLTSFFLRRDIQTAGKLGHNPWEDALAALDLVLLKLQKGVEFGDVTMKPLQMDWDQATPPATNSDSSAATGENKNEKVTKNSVKALSNGLGDNGTKALAQRDGSSSNCHGFNGPGGDGVNDPDDKAGMQKQFYSVASASTQYRDFFELVRNSRKSVAVGGFGDSLPQRSCVSKLSDDSEKKLVRSCRQAMTHQDMICAQLNSFSQRKPDCSEQDAMRKIDTRIRKVMKVVEPKALVTVLLTGDYREFNNAKCFVTIT